MADKVLVTGGTGYVAGWVIVELLKRGYDVRATVRSAAHRCAHVVSALEEFNDHPAGHKARASRHQNLLGHLALASALAVLSLQSYT
jgi:uncharacterized protein YbjT (DUF2867 family)